MNPPSPLQPVVAKINGCFFDYKGSTAFYGLHLAAGQLSMEGRVGVSADSSDAQTELYDNLLYEGNYRWYYPSFCINWDDSVEVRWPRYAPIHTAAQDIMSVPEAVRKYNRIIGCVACLVYKSKSVFDTSNLIKSAEGSRLANWDDPNNRQNHYNGQMNVWGQYRFKRTLLAHHPNGYFLLVVVEGGNDTDATEATINTAQGMNLLECSWMLQELGCDYGMAMDSGSPTQMRVLNSRKYPTSTSGLVTKMGSVVCVYKK